MIQLQNIKTKPFFFSEEINKGCLSLTLKNKNKNFDHKNWLFYKGYEKKTEMKGVMKERKKRETNRVLAWWISASSSFKESLKDLPMEAMYISLPNKIEDSKPNSKTKTKTHYKFSCFLSLNWTIAYRHDWHSHTSSKPSPKAFGRTRGVATAHTILLIN